MAPKKSAAPVAPVAAAPAPVAAKAPKAPKAVKAEKPAAPSKAVVTVPTVEAPSAPAAVEATEHSDVILAGLAEKLKALSTELTTRVREATKSVADAIKATKREAREIKKKKKKNPEDMTPEERKTWEARRANNAFLVQRPLTDELCSFMGLKSGEKRSQTEVTKFISGYVKQHNCFDPNFKRRILPNSALAKLLRVSDKDEVTYLNLQSFLKVHFIKTAPKA
uniref:DM2 domain-containing protein n=1 Tax=viral metagenome TaxID=1070528 RepID=A0A6C0AJB4_9ZZZZ